MKTNQQKLNYVIYWIIIFIIAGSMLVYGVSKPFQFAGFKTVENTSLSEGHQVMWTFYSFTKAYPIMIGSVEVLGAIALLFQRARIFGCLILTIVLSNIIIQDYLYDIAALPSAIFYQILIFIILIYDRRKLKEVLNQLFKSEIKSRNMILMAVAVSIAVFVKFFETRIFGFIFS